MERRELLKAMLAGAGAAMLPRYAMSAGGSDYRALVGIFLLGGNDAYNTVIPSGVNGYSEYRAARTDMALAQSSLLTPGLTTPSVGELGLHPGLSELASLFEMGDAAALLNTGTLMAPVTKAQISDGSAELPEFLFSHNSQQNLAESGTALPRNLHGWGGRLMASLEQGQSDVAPLYSFNGNRKWLRGELGNNLLNAGNIPKLWALTNQERLKGYENVQSIKRGAPMAMELRTIMHRALNNSTVLSDVLSRFPAMGSYPEGNRLANQLKTVESLIQANAELGQGRQVFLVALGGFDTHANLLSKHDELMRTFSQAVGAFQRAINQLGLGQNVTTFTMSDFGRRLTSNGSGTDHGWGGHQLVFGGAVRGGIYGAWPSLAPDSSDHYSLGRVIPTTATDQVSATLCQWMGLEESALFPLFPNLSAFSQPTLGFMA
ncbi:DUF1501 domain-containing protein [Ferrimonas balearica]|uniref:DUF1501 domain-containing protein n=1 Tax=Ferrimonas balearica TaxID=44012 RepID=UPI001C98F253|nr:DUF1501 domain-containing protein [Ferrimonas balearica]MBY5921237.1 DUF1501 domain-containing protein [Ferrimonas balearica]MBY5996078.1 DUF1501 domain-containing protein [Ferrimonas balearica]